MERERRMSAPVPVRGWHRVAVGDRAVWFAPRHPDWIVPNRSADRLLADIVAGATLEQAADRLARTTGRPPVAVRIEALRLVERLDRPSPAPLRPRDELLALDRLEELWLHVTTRCSSACRHCLVAAPGRGPCELPEDLVVRLVDEARALGCRVFFATGGEPFEYPGYAALCRTIAAGDDLHLVTLTNAVHARALDSLWRELPRERFHFQVSLDGTPSRHDARRGAGSHAAAVEGIRLLAGRGFSVTPAMAVDRANLDTMDAPVRLAASLGLGAVHFLWPLTRGRARADARPEPGALFEALRAAERLARDLGVRVDNVAALAARAFSLPGTRWDLTAAGWRSFAVGPDARVYPSAALVLEPELAGEDVRDGLGRAWRESRSLADLRRASVARDGSAPDEDPLALLVGGGDPDHSWVAGRRWIGADPWLELYRRVILWQILAHAGPDDGHPAPRLLARMGERVDACEDGADGCALGRSNCVVSALGGGDPLRIDAFYRRAALEPAAGLRNPDLDRLADGAAPPTAVERSYGCGSPVIDAAPAAGETVVDLGCGAGLECLLAARRVGPEGRVVGLDMLPEMLAAARRAAGEDGSPAAARVRFVRGRLEALPLDDARCDVVISNCVINLSADKRRTLREVLRVLRPGGRFVVADVCCDEEPPARIRRDRTLRGQCLGGAMLQRELLGVLADVGFERIELLRRVAYRTVDGHRFFSVTVRAYRPSRAVATARACYAGPFAAVVTDDGRVLLRGRADEAPLAAGADIPGLAVLGPDGGQVGLDAGACGCAVPSPAPAPVAPGRPSASTHAPPRLPSATRGPAPAAPTGCLVCGRPL
ncbi:MAG: methyltransferase domain-containing protein, partial [Acidobacteria bacterium]